MVAKIVEATFADTYGGVAAVSCLWVIIAYVLMPLGPLAGLNKCSEGHQKWYVFLAPPRNFCNT